MRTLIKTFMKKLKNRATRKHYKRLPEKKPRKVRNSLSAKHTMVHIYGTDFGIFEVEAFESSTENNY